MFRVQDKQCESCIFRKDCPLDTPKLVRKTLQNDGYRVCHHSDDVCCRGFWDRYKNEFNLGRIAQRLKSVVFVAVDTLKPKKKKKAKENV